jgi:SecD/SecF fusion protein
MKNLPLRTALITLLIFVLGLVLYPPQDSLRLGKDLAGGTSLTYTIFLEDVDNPDQTVERMIEILKRRVNPQGLYEISFVRQGNDNLVISMPLPNETVREAKRAFEATVAAVAKYDLDETALRRALRLDGEERRQALQELADTPEHELLINPLIDAVEAAEAAEAAYDAARNDPNADPARLDALQAAAAQARLLVEERLDIALASTVSADRVRAALRRSAQDTVIMTARMNEPLVLPSPRSRAIAELRARLSNVDPNPEDEAGALHALNQAIDAYAAFEEVRRGLDDPADLQRILQGAGVLEFRIAPKPSGSEASPLTQSEEQDLREQLRTGGPESIRSDDWIWAPIGKVEGFIESREDYDRLLNSPVAFFSQRGDRGGYVVEQYDGTYYMLLWDQPGNRLTQAERGGEWAVSNAYPTTDELGRQAIGFEMDARGANLLAELTENNIGEYMAVLLDGQVIGPPPNIVSRISNRGQITGTYTARELQEFINTLAAGSLSAKLGEEPISVVTIAPELGQENLQRGLIAGVVSLGVVAVLMIFYYFTHGVVAVVALFANAVIILGIMSLSRAAFTLPGIAGIVLTFGMAVDANVLIFERIREELIAGNDLRTSVRLGYQKVLSTIVDANVTNLIVCFVLAYTATEEVKGFAITLGVGVVSTMFTALIVSRVMYAWLIDRFGVRHMSQLPLKVPFVQKAFEPSVNWIGLRYVFRLISLAFVALGIGMIAVQGEEMLDTEFRGGTSITLPFKTGDDGQRLSMNKEEVDRRIDAFVDELRAENPESPLVDLQNASTVGRNPDPVTGESSEWQIKTTLGQQEQQRDDVLDAVVVMFTDVIDVPPALAFDGSAAEDARTAPVAPVLDEELGDAMTAVDLQITGIDNEELADDVAEYAGQGLMIVLDDLREVGETGAEGANEVQRPSRDSLMERLQLAREDQQYASDTLKRRWELRVLQGSEAAVESAVILVQDLSVDVADRNSPEYRGFANTEWGVVKLALTQSAPLAGVQSFSAEVAASFRGQAIVAVALAFILILIYIWARFGSVRYSLAAIIALIHDVLIAIGLIAFAEILYENVPFLASIGLEPYKIDLALVAAILTIVGYSLNDTIVILDRIRENRGKLAYASRDVINKSINQTISRTIITSGTTLLALIVLFVEGGPALSSFTYALICGVIVGTYSSIAVAAPLVYTKKIPEAARKYHKGGDIA